MTSTVYVNTDRTVMVRDWGNGMLDVATRANTAEVWGQPVPVNKEQAGYQAPRCECGHTSGEHVCPRGGHMLTVVNGRCLRCECGAFSETGSAAA